jgi:hypothetical protein
MYQGQKIRSILETNTSTHATSLLVTIIFPDAFVRASFYDYFVILH